MGNDHAVHPHNAEAGKNALPPAPRRYNDAGHDGEMNSMNLRLAAALAALVLGGGRALATPVCIDAADPQCAEQTDDPQPNVGDVAPGATDSGAGPLPSPRLPAMPRAVVPALPALPPLPPAPPPEDNDGTKPAE
jgi:hypothetical protein